MNGLDEITNFLTKFSGASINFAVQIIDIFLVAYVVYRILRLVRGTRAWRILGGIVIFAGALFLSDYLHLHTLHWLLDKATLLAPVALVILLLPELRQTLESFARLGLWPERLTGGQPKTASNTVQSIITAVNEMSASRIGCIIVIERVGRLDDIIATGVLLNAKVGETALKSIFYYGNPLHDGAVLIRGDQIISAACRLPLSENTKLDPNIHMRHRAGLGITEQTDALAVIVSEERGSISVAIDGKLHKISDSKELKEILDKEIRGEDEGTKPRRKKRTLRVRKGNED